MVFSIWSKVLIALLLMASKVAYPLLRNHEMVVGDVCVALDVLSCNTSTFFAANFVLFPLTKQPSLCVCMYMYVRVT